MKHAYRPDIDGLRAIAVLSVMLFHFDITAISGGYVGVDVFFVISGFLITRIIRDEVIAGSFSFANFYERRARRIFPSLAAVLILTTIGVVLFFAPADLAAFAKALMSTLLFVSNFYFWQEIGYFTADVEIKPLLHMWSLSVEEQFYFIWPVLLFFLLRKGTPKLVYIILAVLGVISIGIAYGWGNVDPNGAFYLLPTRIYEFIIGGAVVWLVAKQPKRRFVNDVLFLIGLGMIGYSITHFTQQTPFPSYYALVPCLGAGLIIYSGVNARVGILLSNKLMVYLGLISYQLYLVHWPAIVFVKYRSLDAITHLDRGLAALGTLFISMAIYHLIDKPLRKVKTHTDMLNFSIACASVAVVLALLITHMLRFDPGWQWRIDERYRLLMKDALQFHRDQYGGAKFGIDEIIQLGDKTAQPSFIIFGDSYAAQYAHGLDLLLKKEKRMAYALFDHGCLIVPDMTTFLRNTLDATCSSEYQKLYQILAGNTMPVVMAHSWHTYIMQLGDRATGQPIKFESSDAYYRKLIDSIEKTRVELGNRRFVLVELLPGAKNQKSIARCFAVPRFLPSNCAEHMMIPQSEAVDGLQFNGMAETYAAQHPNVTLINPYEAFCQNGMCKVIGDNKIFYSDGNHLSLDGSIYFMDHFKDFFLSLNPDMPAIDPNKSAQPAPVVVPAEASPAPLPPQTPAPSAPVSPLPEPLVEAPKAPAPAETPAPVEAMPALPKDEEMPPLPTNDDLPPLPKD